MILAGDFIPGVCQFKLAEELQGCTILANLEGPICEDGLPPSSKVGVHLHSKSPFLRGEWIFSLANNHLMDYGEEGLAQTKEYLRANKCRFAGAGKDIEEARDPLVVEEDGARIAIFSCCERQFGMATDKTPGCAELGSWLHRKIGAVKRNGIADYVIVSCHAASEFSPWASPSLRAFYHSLVDTGADVIHGHHSHVPQGFEEYNGCPIFYGLGNFVVDPKMWQRNKNALWSNVVNISFGKDKISWNMIPCGIKCEDSVLCIAPLKGDEEREALDYVKDANLPFKNEDMCRGCWQEAASGLYPRIYATSARFFSAGEIKFSFRQRVKLICFAALDLLQAIKGSALKSRYPRFYSKVAYNLMSCPSHVDMMRTYLGLTSGSEKDSRTDEIRSAAKRLGIC